MSSHGSFQLQEARQEARVLSACGSATPISALCLSASFSVSLPPSLSLCLLLCLSASFSAAWASFVFLYYTTALEARACRVPCLLKQRFLKQGRVTCRVTCASRPGESGGADSSTRPPSLQASHGVVEQVEDGCCWTAFAHWA